MPARLLARLYIDAWIVAGLVWLVGAFFTKSSERTESRGSRLTQFAWAFLAAILLWVPWGPLRIRVIPRSLILGDLGLALTLGGISLAIWARFFLGRNWSARVTIKKNHELIRSGPYVIVRNPIYTGFLTALAGTVMVIGELRAILALVIVAVGLHYKVKTEEKFMSDQFGEEYARYRQEVKSLIPFVW